eukprot:TRINITY_DN15222_c0_g1_i1.p2 TRINITY_DN15222_c0_g1~~TRINITY_DN15222_c0_g1_i1.p2  ORF type:complete len:245 (+),score=52.66 TRINITY_DN15222_c0_g1_i1:178-912(+)
MCIRDRVSTQSTWVNKILLIFLNSKMQINITKQVSKFKFVFVGDQSVGKTSIINRFIYDNFTGTQQPTVGIDFVSKTLHIDNKTVRLQLWDTAGQERFRSLIPSYIRDSNAAIIVYDITNQSSFQSLEKWIEYVKEERGEDVVIVLIGNKNDLENKRQVTQQEGENFAKQQNLMFFECSAQNGNNILNVFKALSQQLINSGNQQKPEQIRIQEAEKPKAIVLTTNNQSNANQQQTQGNQQQCSC